MKARITMELPFVGRNAELRSLMEAIDCVKEGHGQFVLIGGEAGIGKTRLANEMVSYSKACGFLTLLGECFENAPQYLPLINAISEIQPDIRCKRRVTISTIEDAFLIYSSGLLISHQTSIQQNGDDSDLIAGMFTALRNFIDDSFKRSSSTERVYLDFCHTTRTSRSAQYSCHVNPFC